MCLISTMMVLLRVRPPFHGPVYFDMGRSIQRHLQCQWHLLFGSTGRSWTPVSKEHGRSSNSAVLLGSGCCCRTPIDSTARARGGRQMWCCKSKHIGCPFDCRDQMDQWQAGHGRGRAEGLCGSGVHRLVRFYGWFVGVVDAVLSTQSPEWR